MPTLTLDPAGSSVDLDLDLVSETECGDVDEAYYNYIVYIFYYFNKPY